MGGQREKDTSMQIYGTKRKKETDVKWDRKLFWGENLQSVWPPACRVKEVFCIKGAFANAHEKLSWSS